MNEIKVNLSIVLPGSTLLSKDECLKTIQKVVTLKNGKKRTITNTVEDWDKTDKHTLRVTEKGSKPEIITFSTRKCRTATQSININKDAYMTMVSSLCPTWFPSSKKWAGMNKADRLELHMKRIAENFSGVSYTYQVFED